MSFGGDKVAIDGDPERKASFKSKAIRQLSVTSLNDGSTKEGQLFSMVDIDPAMDAKMHIVNDAIDEIGWTPLHMKLFCLTGFGYCADSLILLLQAVTAGSAADEFNPSFSNGLTIAVYVGMLVGALFWGLGADVIGRRTAFNVSLFICSVCAIVAGASPNWIVLGLFVSLAAFGAGGNLILDTAVFLEYLPSNKQWLLTLLACWWGLASVIGAAFAWPFLSQARWNCAISGLECNYKNNQGWRYVWYANGVLVLILSVLRVTVVRLHETPKFLLGQGKEKELVDYFHVIATQYGRTCSITLEQLEACGTVTSAHGKKGRFSFSEFTSHMRGLFATRKLGLSTILIWLSWTLIGLAYPLFYVFLPQYLASRGASTGQDTPYYTWRNYMITGVCGIFGPVLAGFMCDLRWLGRRYTMVIGAMVTMVFFFAYTAVRTAEQNLGFACAISFSLNVYYSCLYAYTPEVLPSAHRTTGNGIAVACNRIMGILSAVIATVSNTASTAPIYICSALFIAMAAVALMFPFEPYGRRSM